MDQINRRRDIAETSVSAFAQDLRYQWSHRNNGVTGALQAPQLDLRQRLPEDSKSGSQPLLSERKIPLPPAPRVEGRLMTALARKSAAPRLHGLKISPPEAPASAARASADRSAP